MTKGIKDALIIERDATITAGVAAPAITAAEIDSHLLPCLEARA